MLRYRDRSFIVGLTGNLVEFLVNFHSYITIYISGTLLVYHQLQKNTLVQHNTRLLVFDFQNV